MCKSITALNKQAYADTARHFETSKRDIFEGWLMLINWVKIGFTAKFYSK